jgi:hypothetical protein
VTNNAPDTTATAEIPRKILVPGFVFVEKRIGFSKK